MNLQWQSDEYATLHGIPVSFVRNNYDQHKTTDESIVVLKSRPWFERYELLFSDLNGGAFNFIELGIFEGGSALLFAEYFPMARILGFDLRGENPSVYRHLKKMSYSDRVMLNYRTSQSGAAKIVEKSKTFFGDDPIHLVVDDASHHYEHTRASFEIIFPMLSPGGKYVIEDWGWAHWPTSAYDHWSGVAMSSLILELVMALASKPSMFGTIEVSPRIVIITKGERTSTERFDLDKVIKLAPRSWQPLQLMK